MFIPLRQFVLVHLILIALGHADLYTAELTLLGVGLTSRGLNGSNSGRKEERQVTL